MFSFWVITGEKLLNILFISTDDQEMGVCPANRGQKTSQKVGANTSGVLCGSIFDFIQAIEDEVCEGVTGKH
jgi:hypothetical protein